jgi:hypothetical protein
MPLAGCSALSGRPTGRLVARVRNLTAEDRSVGLRVFLDGADDPQLDERATLEAATEPPWPERRWLVAEDVAQDTPYRVVVDVDGAQFESTGIADCIGHETVAGSGQSDPDREQIEISVESDDNTKILMDYCPDE